MKSIIKQSENRGRIPYIATVLSAVLIIGGASTAKAADLRKDHAVYENAPKSAMISEAYQLLLNETERVNRSAEERALAPAEVESEAEATLTTGTGIADDLEYPTVPVYIDEDLYCGQSFLKDGMTYVELEEFTSTVAEALTVYDSKSEVYCSYTESIKITAKPDAEFIVANGRYFWTRTGTVLAGGKLYVPVQALGYALGASVNWCDETASVYVCDADKYLTHGDEYYDADEVYWLAKIINAESRGESLTGKIAVGNVVLNRVKNSQYPNTIYGVIFDNTYGVQFSPTADGSISLEADEESVIAAKLCLEGYTVSDSILFFINSSIAADMWVKNTRTLTVSIGSHEFYS